MYNNKIACKFAIIRFEAFVETEEFANIGIVLFAPEENFFDFKILEKRHSRITHFFREFNGTRYSKIIKNYNKELSYLKEFITSNSVEIRSERMFSELIKNREGIIRFSKVRVILSKNPKIELEKLYEYYIERSFTKQDNHEKIIENNIARLFEDNHFRKRFVSKEIGNELYSANFPFVEKLENPSVLNQRDIKVIKPFYLAHKHPKKIIEHSLNWASKLQYLRNELPKKILFVVEQPSNVICDDFPATEKYNDRAIAFEEAKKLLIKTNIVEFANSNNSDEILSFVN